MYIYYAHFVLAFIVSSLFLVVCGIYVCLFMQQQPQHILHAHSCESICPFYSEKKKSFVLPEQQHT